MSAERDHVAAYRARLTFYVRAWWCLLGALLVLAASLPAQQHPRSMDRPLILWEPMPTIGVDSADAERVNDDLPAIATADWPEFTDSVIAGLARCTGLRAPKAWQVRTVAAPAFTVRIWVNGKWYDHQAFAGYTFQSVHRIYVVQIGLRSRRLIRHELLHAILADNGLNPAHGAPLANELFPRCAPEAD